MSDSARLGVGADIKLKIPLSADGRTAKPAKWKCYGPEKDPCTCTWVFLLPHQASVSSTRHQDDNSTAAGTLKSTSQCSESYIEDGSLLALFHAPQLHRLPAQVPAKREKTWDEEAGARWRKGAVHSALASGPPCVVRISSMSSNMGHGPWGSSRF